MSDEPDEDDPWAELLGSPARSSAGPTLVVNTSAAAVRAIASVRDEGLREHAIRGLYAVGVLSSGEALGQRRSGMLDASLQALISAAGRA